MVTKFYLKSAQDLNADIIDKIKNDFNSKPITIIVEESVVKDYLPKEFEEELEKRLSEPGMNDLSAEESIQRLKKKYEI